VLIITLNAPETLNAFTGPMHTSMSRIWDDVNDDPEVHLGRVERFRPVGT